MEAEHRYVESISSIEAKRRQCMLGDLPDDFLRVQTSGPAAQNAPYVPVEHYVPQEIITIGQLELTITQAKLAKNYGLSRMDPYCRVRIGHRLYETPTAINGSKNPKWNKRIYAQLAPGVDAVYIEIYDEKTLTDDDRIAWTTIILPPSIFCGDTVDDWYPLSGRQGEEKEGMVNLIISYRELQQSRPAYPVVYHQPVTYATAPSVYMAPQSSLPGGPPSTVVPVPQPAPQHQHRQVPPAVVAVSDADVQAIQEVFPILDAEVVRSVLMEKRGDKEATINALLQMTQE